MRTITRDILDEELKFHSDAVSKGVRLMAFGAIAGVWAVLTAEGLVIADGGLFGWRSSVLVTWTFIFASLTLLFDIVQYVAAYCMTNIGIDRWEQREDAGEMVEFGYDKENLGSLGVGFYWINYWSLRAKLALAVAAGAAFVCFTFAIELG